MQFYLSVRYHRVIHHWTVRIFCWALVGLTTIATTAWGVNPGEPSWTAEGTTAYRAIAALDPDARIRNPDYLAHKLISHEYWKSAKFPLNYAKSKRFIDKYKISIYFFVNARTKHIDRLLERAAVDGTRQVVNLGAGYDSRAYRFAERMPDVVFFELDLPATIDAKRKRLLTFMEAIPDQVKLLKIDFNTQTLEQVLLDAGYSPSLKTFFIWEGVTYYISEAAVDGTLSFIATMSSPGSSVVFDYMPNAVIQKAYQDYPDARGPMARVAKMGEPWVFGISEGRAECYANKQGLQVLSILYPREMESRYLYRSDGTLDGRAPTYFRIMHAVVPQSKVRQALVKNGCSPLTSVAPERTIVSEKTAPQTVPSAKIAAAQFTFTNITGIWTGTDTLGGKLVFTFFTDDTYTSRRVEGQGRYASLKTGTYSCDEAVIKGEANEFNFTAEITGNTLKGKWTQAPAFVSANFTLAKQVSAVSAGEVADVNQLLQNWVRYWDAEDVNGIMNLVHTDARMMYGGFQQKMATYEEYPHILPGRMTLIGNMVLTKPDIRLSGDKGTIKCKMDSPVGYLPITFKVKKDNSDWRIIRFEYEL